MVNDDTPFDGKDDANVPEGAVDIDGVKMCGSDRVVSNTDDWNATVTPPLAHTGATVTVFGVLAAVLMGGAGMLLSLKRRTSGAPRHMA